MRGVLLELLAECCFMGLCVWCVQLSMRSGVYVSVCVAQGVCVFVCSSGAGALTGVCAHPVFPLSITCRVTCLRSLV